MEKSLFKTGLFASFLAHAVIIMLLSLPHSKTLKTPDAFTPLEVTYQDLQTLKKEKKEDVVKDLKVTKDLKSHDEQKVKVLDKRENMFSAFGSQIKDMSKLSGKLLDSQKNTSKITTLDLSRKITLPPMGSAKITNPQYLTYNDDMRAAISRNIKARAYTYVNHSDFEAGKVYLTFVLASSGELKQLQIIDSKTSANDYLRKVAMRSIQESSPFAPFTKGFDYPEFTFNLLISFQD